MKKCFLAIICLVLILNSCSKDNDISQEPVGITLNFNHSWEGAEITNVDFDDLKFTNENGDLLSIKLLRYLISEIILTHESGVITVLEDYTLVDVTNNEGLSFTTTEAIIPGEYTRVTVRFGFSDANNIDGAYPDLNTANFNVPGLLGGGYHFMQFDGKYINLSLIHI